MTDGQSTNGTEQYIDIREIHPACVLLPCRYEGCDNERWVCGPGSTKEYTICPECYDGPDVNHLLPKPVVRI